MGLPENCLEQRSSQGRMRVNLGELKLTRWAGSPVAPWATVLARIAGSLHRRGVSIVCTPDCVPHFSRLTGTNRHL
jgi:hypothetical protein